MNPIRPTEWDWLDTAVATGSVGVPGDDARRRIFAADRDGPEIHRLLTLATDPRIAVRRTLFGLLHSLCPAGREWDAAAEVAGPALTDEDPPVRLMAATLLVTAGGLDRALAAFAASTDPMVRVALVEAMPFTEAARHDGARWHSVVTELALDRVPAVRLLANVDALRRSRTAAARPALDAAIRADLEACEGVLDAPGRSGWHRC